jgi:WD40 repeat protein
MFTDGKHIIGGGTQAIWDLDDPRRVQDLPRVPNQGSPEVVAVAPNDQHIALGMRNGTIALWARDGTIIPLAVEHTAWVEALAFSRDGRVLASSDQGGTVLLTDAASGAPLGKVVLPFDRATFLWWTADSAQLAIDTAQRFQIHGRPRIAVASGGGPARSATRC